MLILVWCPNLRTYRRPEIPTLPNILEHIMATVEAQPWLSQSDRSSPAGR